MARRDDIIRVLQRALPATAAVSFLSQDDVAVLQDPAHPEHPRELAIALRAWAESRRAESRDTPRKRLMAWLRRSYGGQLAESARERIATVANYGPGKR